MSVHGKTVAVLGGDRRMAEVVYTFCKSGARVRMAGIPWEDRFDGAQACRTGADALTGADVLVLPVQGVESDGQVYTLPSAPVCYLDREALQRMNLGGTVFAGIGNTYLRELCSEAGLPLMEYREADEFAIWNSIPSAEGAIQMAMEASDITIFGSRSLVVGFGRTGRAIALLLKGLFSEVTVTARKETDLSKIWASGYRYVTWEHLPEAVAAADIIYNTAPAMVLPRPVLERARPGTVVIDVASAPGGTDFVAARELGITAKLAPGLPGIVAPVTAGKIIAELIIRHLANQKAEEGKR